MRHLIMKETEICKGKKNTKARFLLERSGPEKFVTMGPTTYGPQHGLRTPSGPPRLSVLALQGVGARGNSREMAHPWTWSQRGFFVLTGSIGSKKFMYGLTQRPHLAHQWTNTARPIWHRRLLPLHCTSAQHSSYCSS